MDGSIAPTSGECKEGMEISYDGQWGYAPLIVTAGPEGRSALCRQPLGQPSLS